MVSVAEVLRRLGRPARSAELVAVTSRKALESMLRALLISNGVDGFEPQVAVRSGTFRARVDLGHRAAQVALEAEGYEFHGSADDFAADCGRYDELVMAGWAVLRFTYQHVIGNPAWVVRTTEAAVGRGIRGPKDRR
jgi:very-short-patch-repair endonuclease